MSNPLILALTLGASPLLAQEEKEKPAGPFASQTIDLGVVVSDLEKSLAFYKGIVGMTEVPGFKVEGDFPKKVGLTDGAGLDIHVLVLGEGETATKLKVMQVKSERPAKTLKQRHIHTNTGFSYITIMVTDVDAVLERAQKAGLSPTPKVPSASPKASRKPFACSC